MRFVSPRLAAWGSRVGRKPFHSQRFFQAGNDFIGLLKFLPNLLQLFLVTRFTGM